MQVTQNELQRLRQQFPQGARVELVRMNDIQAPSPGTKGTVRFVDDIGTIHVHWDNGAGLGSAYGEDACRKIEGD